MLLNISHTTRYTYNQPMNYSLQKVRLRPTSSAMQTVLDWKLDIAGGKDELSYTDHHQNTVDLVSSIPGTTSLEITASGTVETHDTHGVFGCVYDAAPLWYFLQDTTLTNRGKGIMRLSNLISKDAPTLDELHTMSTDILKAVPYTLGKTYSDTPAEAALNGAHGVCQDHAHIFIAAARNAGIPARYVSGYLMMNDRIDQDASHAWAEVHLDTIGWVGFDVSNGISPDERYVRIATGLDSQDAAPISGLRLGSSDETMIVSLQVQQ
jgi:transglutaminase-like putative cysteine protease